MGKYIDINKVLEATIEVPQKYWEVEELMREKPNFDKSVGSKKIYERKEYAIYKVKHGYIVHNTKKNFEEGHTHIHNYNKAKKYNRPSCKKEDAEYTKEMGNRMFIKNSKG